MRAIAAVMAIAVTALASCSSTESAPAPYLPRDVAGKVTADGMYAHLRKLQEIADEYKQIAGFEIGKLNTRPSLSVRLATP